MTNRMTWNDALAHYNASDTYSKRAVAMLGPDGENKTIDNLYSIVNDRTGQPLPGVGVNGRYEIIQTTAYADIGNAITGELGAEFVGGGSLMGGKGLFLQAKLPDSIRVRGTDDVVDKMLTFLTSHDGSLCFMVAFLGVRLFCANQFKSIGDELRNGDKIRHTRNAGDRLKEAARVVLDAHKAYRSLQLKLDWMTEQAYSSPQTTLATRRLFGVKDDVVEADIPTRTRNNIVSVMETIATGPGQDCFRGTAYNVWNGMTHWVDHVRSLRSNTDRFEAGLIGSGEKLKDRAIQVVEATLQDTPAPIVSYAS